MTRRRTTATSQKTRRVYRRVRLPLVRIAKLTIVKRKPTAKPADNVATPQTSQTAFTDNTHSAQELAQALQHTVAAASLSHTTNQPATLPNATVESTNTQYNESNATAGDHTNTAIATEIKQDDVKNSYAPHTLTEIASFNPECNPYMNFVSGMTQILVALPNEAFQAPTPEKNGEATLENSEVTPAESNASTPEKNDTLSAEQHTRSVAPLENTNNQQAAPQKPRKQTPHTGNPYQAIAATTKPQPSNAPQKTTKAKHIKSTVQDTPKTTQKPQEIVQEIAQETPTKAPQTTTAQAVPKHAEQASKAIPNTKKLKITHQTSAFQPVKPSSKHPFSYLQLPKASLRSCPDSVLQHFTQQVSKTPASASDKPLSESAPPPIAASKNKPVENDTKPPTPQNTWASSPEFAQLMTSLSAVLTTHNSNSTAFTRLMQQRSNDLLSHYDRWGHLQWENTPNKLGKMHHFAHNPISTHQVACSGDITQGYQTQLKKKHQTNNSMLSSRFARHYGAAKNHTEHHAESNVFSIRFIETIAHALHDMPVTTLASQEKAAKQSKHTSSAAITREHLKQETIPRDTIWVCQVPNSVSIFEFDEEHVVIHQPLQCLRLHKSLWKRLWIQANERDPHRGSPRQHVQACRYLLFGRTFSHQHAETIIRYANQSPLRVLPQ